LFLYLILFSIDNRLQEINNRAKPVAVFKKKITSVIERYVVFFYQALGAISYLIGAKEFPLFKLLPPL
jgi:hypothetical protein